MATDPPYLVDYDGGNHPQTWKETGTLKTSAAPPRRRPATGTPTPTTTRLPRFYRDFSRWRSPRPWGQRPAIYQWFGMLRMAWSKRPGLPTRCKLHQVLSGTRAAPCWGAAGSCGTTSPAPWAGLRGASRRGRAPPAGRGTRRLARRPEGGRRGGPAAASIPLSSRSSSSAARSSGTPSPASSSTSPSAACGTAIIAAQLTGRRCHAIELAPAFVDVAIRRWQAFTGESATLAGDGRTLRDRRRRAGELGWPPLSGSVFAAGHPCSRRPAAGRASTAQSAVAATPVARAGAGRPGAFPVRRAVQRSRNPRRKTSRPPSMSSPACRQAHPRNLWPTA